MAEQRYKKIPYGISSFETLRNDGYYYVDKSRYIQVLEDAARYPILLRPRRFGKSLFLNMVACYYDVLMAHRFNDFFGDLYIGQHPTGRQNTLMVMRFDFSNVSSCKAEVQASFNKVVTESVRGFVEKYASLMGIEPKEEFDFNKMDAMELFGRVKNVIAKSAYKAYVIIDEYDNFCNSILADNEDDYLSITHGDGYVRSFFASLKAGTSASAPIDRILISGVSPLTLSDVTSGFNIGLNISAERDFNEAIGFSESEVRTMIDYYRTNTDVIRHNTDELLDIMRPYYNNNCFSADVIDEALETQAPDRPIQEVCYEKMYNSDMVLYFLTAYMSKGGRIPVSMTDTNISTDYNKLTMLVRYDQTFDQKSRLMQRALVNGELEIMEFKREFSVAELHQAESLPSLLFYLGMLTFGIGADGTCGFIVPNEVVRLQYYRYLQNTYSNTLQWRADIATLNSLWAAVAKHGEWQPFVAYVSGLMTDVSSIRDFDSRGEAFVKGMMLCYLGSGSGYTTFSEPELNHGYSDIYMRPLTNYKHALVLELKYCKPSSPDSDVEKLKRQARKQLRAYVADKHLQEEAAARGFTLHKGMAVFRGHKLEALEDVKDVRKKKG